MMDQSAGQKCQEVTDTVTSAKREDFKGWLRTYLGQILLELSAKKERISLMPPDELEMIRRGAVMGIVEAAAARICREARDRILLA